MYSSDNISSKFALGWRQNGVYTNRKKSRFNIESPEIVAIAATRDPLLKSENLLLTSCTARRSTCDGDVMH